MGGQGEPGERSSMQGTQGRASRRLVGGVAYLALGVDVANVGGDTWDGC